MSSFNHIFLCGLSRTGKNSVRSVLELLGLGPSIRFPLKYNDLSNYQICYDLPIIYWMDQLLIDYPNAKWIMTTRNLDSWLNECENFFSRDLNYLPNEIITHILLYRNLIYGSSIYNKDKWINTYIEHEDNVKRKIPQDRLLHLNLDDLNDNALEHISTFLQISTSSIKTFPHLNAIGDWEKFFHEKD